MELKLSKVINSRKRVGRGPASGKGKTSGRGMNGQRSRTGSSTAFQEGGQTSFVMRLPKAKGFKSTGSSTFSISVQRLETLFDKPETLSAKIILEKLKLDSKFKSVKVYGKPSSDLRFKFDESVKTSKSLETK